MNRTFTTQKIRLGGSHMAYNMELFSAWMDLCYHQIFWGADGCRPHCFLQRWLVGGSGSGVVQKGWCSYEREIESGVIANAYITLTIELATLFKNIATRSTKGVFLRRFRAKLVNVDLTNLIALAIWTRGHDPTTNFRRTYFMHLVRISRRRRLQKECRAIQHCWSL